MGRGVGGNEKWEQNRELEMKLLIGLRFKAGFFPFVIFPFPVLVLCSTFPVLVTSFRTLYLSSIGFFVL